MKWMQCIIAMVVTLFLSQCGGGSNTQMSENETRQDTTGLAREIMDMVNVAENADSLDIDSESQKANIKKEQERERNIVTELDGAKLKKTVSYPYISVKFYQKDTDVEMVLDPLSTNIDLELKRHPDGMFEVHQGDELLTRGGGRSDSLSNRNELASKPFDPTEDLTDDIIRDINMAQQLFYEQKYDQALNVLSASLQKKQTASAYALGGSIYYVNGDTESAVQSWENALQINPQLQELRTLVSRIKSE